MGADGAIKIYDMEKFRGRFTPKDVKWFWSQIGDAVTYLQRLGDKEYMTIYYGSNLDATTTYDIIRFCYDAKTDDFLRDSWCWESWMIGVVKEGTTRKQRRLLAEMVAFMESECQITAWEVWT